LGLSCKPQLVGADLFLPDIVRHPRRFQWRKGKENLFGSMMDHCGTAGSSTMTLVLVTAAYLLAVSPVTVESSSSSSAALLLSPAEISSRPTDKMLANTIDTSEDECKSIFPSVFSLWRHSVCCPVVGFNHDAIVDDGGTERKCVYFHLTRSIESVAFSWMFSFEDDPAVQI
jgi:hypothetical protein